MQRRRAESVPPASSPVDKWHLLRELAAGRKHWNLSHRTLNVLQALLSFHPGSELGQGNLVVFPSNRAICDRLHGMPCSTMRRHLAILVRAEFIERRDSPNGKRFVRRDRAEHDAYGFDLAALARRHAEICTVADDVRALEAEITHLRREIGLMRRDLAGLAQYGATTSPDMADWNSFLSLARDTGPRLRRSLARGELKAIAREFQRALETVQRLLAPPASSEMSTSDGEIEQHLQKSEKENLITENAMSAKSSGSGELAGLQSDVRNQAPRVPMALVLSTCTELRTYVQDKIQHWADFVRAVEIVRPMLGISHSTWLKAVETMGLEQAAVTVAAILERYEEIRSPGAYLCTLASRAQDGRFSCSTMIMALARRTASCSSQL